MDSYFIQWIEIQLNYFELSSPQIWPTEAAPNWLLYPSDVPLLFLWVSLVAQMVKNLPAMRVQSLAWKDPLEKGMATYSSILAWRIPWTEEPDGLYYIGSQRIEHDWAINTIYYVQQVISVDPKPRIVHLSMESSFILVRMIFINQHLVSTSECTHCFLGLTVFKPS